MFSIPPRELDLEAVAVGVAEPDVTVDEVPILVAGKSPETLGVSTDTNLSAGLLGRLLSVSESVRTDNGAGVSSATLAKGLDTMLRMGLGTIGDFPFDLCGDLPLMSGPALVGGLAYGLAAEL
jgi:hypothetical protein